MTILPIFRPSARVKDRSPVAVGRASRELRRCPNEDHPSEDQRCRELPPLRRNVTFSGARKKTKMRKANVNLILFTIIGRAELAKKKKLWTTFGSRQLATAIVAYLKDRRERGEVLGPSSALVTAGKMRGVALHAKEGARSQLGFVSTTRLVFEVAQVLHSTAPKGYRVVPVRPPWLLHTAMVRAGVDPVLREEMMSHDTGVAGAYTVGKRWGDDLLEAARKEVPTVPPSDLETLRSRPKTDVKDELIADLIEARTGARPDPSVRGEALVRLLRDSLSSHPSDDSLLTVERPERSPRPP